MLIASSFDIVGKKATNTFAFLHFLLFTEDMFTLGTTSKTESLDVQNDFIPCLLTTKMCKQTQTSEKPSKHDFNSTVKYELY